MPMHIKPESGGGIRIAFFHGFYHRPGEKSMIVYQMSLKTIKDTYDVKMYLWNMALSLKAGHDSRMADDANKHLKCPSNSFIMLILVVV